MDRVIAVRIGESQERFNRIGLQGTWSSPEGPSSSAIRESFLTGYTVYAVFCDRADTPLYITKISNVRPRILGRDTIPIENALGSFEVFMEFQPLTTINILGVPVFDAVTNCIRYTRGHQIIINTTVADSIIAYYSGFFDGFTRVIQSTPPLEPLSPVAPVAAPAAVAAPVPLPVPTQCNTTTLFPSTDQIVIDDLRRLWTYR